MSNSGKNNKADIGLRVESARTFDELDKHADAWNTLALNAPQQHPVLTHAWISAYLKTSIPASESWFCLFAFDNDDLVGVLPLLAREYKLLWNKYLSLRTPNDPHTMSVDFLFKGNYGQSVIQLFASYLNILRPKVMRLSMKITAYNSATIGILKKGIHGIYSSYYPNGNVDTISVEGSFQDYKNKLSKKFIGNLRRSNNSLKKSGGFAFTVNNKGSEAHKNLLTFAIMEQSGWKGKMGSAILDKSWKFFEQLVSNIEKNGWLKWFFLKTENKIIAGWLAIPFGRSCFIFKTCYDEAYARYKPGSVLTEKMIEHIFSTGKYDIINFFTDYEWHLNWNVERRSYYLLFIAFNNPVSFFITHIPYSIYSKFSLVRRLKGVISRFI